VFASKERCLLELRQLFRKNSLLSYSELTPNKSFLINLFEISTNSLMTILTFGKIIKQKRSYTRDVMYSLMRCGRL